MNIFFKIIFLFSFLSVSSKAFSQEEKFRHSFDYQGQLSVWGHFAPDIEQALWFGGRYIPQLNYEMLFDSNWKIDFELSANLFGDVGIKSFTEADGGGKIKPYRAWARYSTQQMEVRAGLQKINFGSAQMFRPLMWFDTMDPRDPLQLTDGVWGGLFRYYFQNNANVWLWALYGNKANKAWETAPSSQSLPELGGRVQLPLKQGEIAFSYHFRETDYSGVIYPPFPQSEKIAENRLGFDIRLDRVVGMWFEASWAHLNKQIDIWTNQTMFTLGGDYTFGVGKGLGLTLEQMLFSYDEKAFALENTTTFSGIMLNYPLTIFDSFSAMFFYDWQNKNMYSFFSWQHDFEQISIHGMLYWNPRDMIAPTQIGSDRFFGKGVQIMLVWNH